MFKMKMLIIPYIKSILNNNGKKKKGFKVRLCLF